MAEHKGFPEADAVERKPLPEAAEIHVLVARSGDQIPHQLSEQRPLGEQLEQLVRIHGEGAVTVNGRPYADFADEYGLYRHGNTEEAIAYRERAENEPVVEPGAQAPTSTRDVNELAKASPRDVGLMTDDELRQELRGSGVGFADGVDRDTLEALVTEERAERLPK